LERSIAFEFSVISCKLLVFGEEKNTREKKNYTEFAEDTEVTEKRREERKPRDPGTRLRRAWGNLRESFQLLVLSFWRRDPKNRKKPRGSRQKPAGERGLAIRYK